MATWVLFPGKLKKRSHTQYYVSRGTYEEDLKLFRQGWLHKNSKMSLGEMRKPSFCTFVHSSKCSKTHAFALRHVIINTKCQQTWLTLFKIDSTLIFPTLIILPSHECELATIEPTSTNISCQSLDRLHWG